MRLRALRLQSIFTYLTRPRQEEEEEVPGHLEEGKKTRIFQRYGISPFLDVAFAPPLPLLLLCLYEYFLSGEEYCNGVKSPLLVGVGVAGTARYWLPRPPLVGGVACKGWSGRAL